MWIDIFAAAITAGTPLLFATLGEIYTERVGNTNLGVEGMMIMGAVVGFSTGFLTQNAALALAGAVLAGSAGALIYAIITITLRANQIVTGLALTIFGTGFASFVGKPYVGKAAPEAIKNFFRVIEIPLLSDIPFIGEILFKHDVFVYLGYIVTFWTLIYFYKTRWGLNLRSIGESAASADASGINIDKYKYIHTIIGGALAGLGGAYLSLVTIPVWQEGVTGGRGWIAVALVIFASWKPIKAMFGALLFGGLDIIGFRLQGMGIHVSQYLIDMLPYLTTIVVLIISTRKNKPEDMPPADLSIPYFREER
ncbi:MAG: ABC transporter permease [Proteocatella sp.]|nr:ABC transporter permease [Proteocatella sp.]MBP8654215.1 ABC transporter permease [Proteocatella sp.]MBP9658834.1 ABC transporter permease [Proteocatella sp.]MBP9966771.1 ABC transporter permease [Proteocatella sp.]